jgi:arylsulfatase A-like enzyme
MPPYKPPNYNEEDVSDKPLWVQDQPLLTDPYAEGWPMAKYCREMLGVDWMTKQIVDELAAENRLDNTLLVFTADNGSHWGIHRIGQKKLTPYSAPVPLYMSWPDRWGNQQHEITESVSNIDLAPTFCALAGSCTLGPYPTGQSMPDGKSLLPILDDPRGDGIARDAVLEAAFSGRRTWHGTRTSPDSELGWWHYVEWEDGSVELYDLVADPWEMDSQHQNPDLAAVRAQLSARLAELWAEGRIDPV